jgi:hypothetical protein
MRSEISRETLSRSAVVTGGGRIVLTACTGGGKRPAGDGRPGVEKVDYQ